jgi:hypothetical protein
MTLLPERVQFTSTTNSRRIENGGEFEWVPFGFGEARSAVRPSALFSRLGDSSLGRREEFADAIAERSQ